MLKQNWTITTNLTLLDKGQKWLQDRKRFQQFRPVKENSRLNKIFRHGVNSASTTGFRHRPELIPKVGRGKYWMHNKQWMTQVNGIRDMDIIKTSFVRLRDPRRAAITPGVHTIMFAHSSVTMATRCTHHLQPSNGVRHNPQPLRTSVVSCPPTSSRHDRFIHNKSAAFIT